MRSPRRQQASAKAPLHATGHAGEGYFPVALVRLAGDGHVKSLLPDDKGRFILVERGAPKFLHADTALRYTQIHAVIEDYGTIHHKLQEAERLSAGMDTVLAAEFRGEESGHAVHQQPLMEAVDFALSGCGVREHGENDVQGVENDAPRAHLHGLGGQRRQHAPQIEIARMNEVGQRLRVDQKQSLGLQLGKLPAKTFKIRHDAFGTFLECDENARLMANLHAMSQELQSEDGLARAGAAGQQRSASVRQTSARDFIETGNAGGSLGWRCRQTGSASSHTVSLQHEDRSRLRVRGLPAANVKNSAT